MSNVLISIASEYDSKGTRQADKSFKALTKSVAKFTGSLALAHKAQKAMLSYIADEKATKILAQNLKNLNLAYAVPSAEAFIKNMQTQTGILDDELRPAYAQLARVTGSTIETQKLMALAFDVSAGTGKDYADVINALSQAYVGNNKGLRSLNIGLSQADLKTKSFADITEILNKQFAGSGNASLDSYAGKMALLQVAAADASESIGKGLLDAITTASGPGGFPTFIKAIEKSAQIISDLATGTGRLIALFDIAASPSKGIGDWLKKYRDLRKKWDAEDLQVMKERAGIANNTSSYFEKQAKDSILAAKIAKTQKSLAAARLASEKKITLEKKAQQALDKANIALGAANNVFDIERIGVAAAMQNQTLTENEKKRLEIKQAIFALEDAIDSKDTARITKQTDILNGLLGQFATMQSQDKLLGQIKLTLDGLGVNKDLINLLNLQEALRLLQEMAKIKIGGISSGGGGGGGGGGGKTIVNKSGIVYNPPKPEDKPDGVTTEDWNKIIGDYNNAFNEEVVVPPPSGTSSSSNILSIFAKAEKDRLNALNIQQSQNAAKAEGLAARYGGYVTVNIAGDLQKLIDSITYETQNASANGTPIMLDRNATNLAW